MSPSLPRWPVGRRRSLMTYPRWLPLLIVLGLATLAAPAMGQVELYAKEDSLQQTLLETRARLQRWQAAQRDARQAIRVGAWQQATLAAEPNFDGIAVTRPDAAADSQGQLGNLRWAKCPADASGNPNLGGSTADYLCTTVTVDKPVTLTIELSRPDPQGGGRLHPGICRSQARWGRRHGLRPVRAAVYLRFAPRQADRSAP